MDKEIIKEKIKGIKTLIDEITAEVDKEDEGGDGGEENGDN